MIKSSTGVFCSPKTAKILRTAAKMVQQHSVNTAVGDLAQVAQERKHGVSTVSMSAGC